MLEVKVGRRTAVWSASGTTFEADPCEDRRRSASYETSSHRVSEAVVRGYNGVTVVYINLLQFSSNFIY